MFFLARRLFFFAFGKRVVRLAVKIVFRLLGEFIHEFDFFEKI